MASNAVGFNATQTYRASNHHDASFATFFLELLLYRLYAKIKRRDGRSVGLQILSDASNNDHVKYEYVASLN